MIQVVDAFLIIEIINLGLFLNMFVGEQGLLLGKNCYPITVLGVSLLGYLELYSNCTQSANKVYTCSGTIETEDLRIINFYYYYYS